MKCLWLLKGCVLISQVIFRCVVRNLNMTSADVPSLVSLQCHVLSQYFCTMSECNTHFYVNI